MDLINVFVLWYYLSIRRRRDVYDSLIKIRGATVRGIGLPRRGDARASPRVMAHGVGQGGGNRTAPERALSSRDMYTAARACARGAASREETRPPEGIEPPLRGLKPRVLPLDQSGFGRRRGASVVFFVIR